MQELIDTWALLGMMMVYTIIIITFINWRFNQMKKTREELDADLALLGGAVGRVLKIVNDLTQKIKDSDVAEDFSAETDAVEAVLSELSSVAPDTIATETGTTETGTTETGTTETGTTETGS